MHTPLPAATPVNHPTKAFWLLPRWHCGTQNVKSVYLTADGDPDACIKLDGGSKNRLWLLPSAAATYATPLKSTKAADTKGQPVAHSFDHVFSPSSTQERVFKGIHVAHGIATSHVAANAGRCFELLPSAPCPCE